jgi:hypothetical protein
MARKSKPANPKPTNSNNEVKRKSALSDPAVNENEPKSELGLSDLRLRLNFLEKENEKLIKQIETNKKKLDNLNESIEELGLQLIERTAPFRQKVMELDNQIHDAFAEIFTARKFGKQSKKDIESIYHHLQAGGIISPRNLANEQNSEEDSPESEFGNDENEHWHNQKKRSQPEQLPDIPKLDREEQKKIRQVFLRLADNFHPDKVTDAAEKEARTEVMKEINLAYQNGDLARLLIIEKQQELGVLIDRDDVDDLTRQCSRVEAENEFLKSQLNDVKLELKLTKKSEGGELATAFNQMVKLGDDPIAEALSGVEEEVEIMEEMYKFVSDFRDRRITIKEFVKGPVSLVNKHIVTEEELMLEFLAQFR